MLCVVVGMIDAKLSLNLQGDVKIGRTGGNPNDSSHQNTTDRSVQSFDRTHRTSSQHQDFLFALYD
jgi:hypothetical protein